MEQKTYVFNFNFVELNTLIKACKELPYKETAGLIQKIINEYEEQTKAEEVKVKK